MKKVLWLIVCLMTITMTFSSCSKDDEQKEEESINISGAWTDANEYLFCYFCDGTGDIVSDSHKRTSNFKVEYSIKGNEIVFRKVTDASKRYDEDIKRYERLIKSLQYNLKTAKGKVRIALIDKLNDYIHKLDIAKEAQEKINMYSYSKAIITKFTPTELFLQFPNEEIKLYKRKNNNN